MKRSQNKCKSETCKSERGNVLFFLLLAIMLLGAITLVLSRGGSSTEETGSVERGRILASELLRFARSVDSGVQQLKFSVSENDLSFENSLNSASHPNDNCTTNNCKIFHVDGAGLQMLSPPPKAVSDPNAEWSFTGANAVGTSADPIGSTANDLIIYLTDIRQYVCTEINKLMSVNGGDIPTDTTGMATTAFAGSFTGSSIIDGDATPFELDGEQTACFYDDGLDKYVFYHVLVKR